MNVEFAIRFSDDKWFYLCKIIHAAHAWLVWKIQPNKVQVKQKSDIPFESTLNLLEGGKNHKNLYPVQNCNMTKRGNLFLFLQASKNTNFNIFH